MKLQYYILAGAIAISALFVTLRENPTDTGVSRPRAQANSKVPDGWRIGATQSTLTKQLGLRSGDVVIKMNGDKFSGSLEDFGKVRKHCESGQSVSVEFWRDGSVQTRSKAIDLSLANTERVEFGANVLEPELDSSDLITEK